MICEDEHGRRYRVSKVGDIYRIVFTHPSYPEGWKVHRGIRRFDSREEAEEALREYAMERGMRCQMEDEHETLWNYRYPWG